MAERVDSSVLLMGGSISFLRVSCDRLFLNSVCRLVVLVNLRQLPVSLTVFRQILNCCVLGSLLGLVETSDSVVRSGGQLRIMASWLDGKFGLTMRASSRPSWLLWLRLLCMLKFERFELSLVLSVANGLSFSALRKRLWHDIRCMAVMCLISERVDRISVMVLLVS